MLRDNERDIVCFELSFESSSKIATFDFDIEGIFQSLSEAKKKGFHSKPIRIDKHDLDLQLRDFSIRDGQPHVIGYVVITDPRISASVYRSTASGLSRASDKKADDIDEFGGHFFIEREPVREGVWRMYIEKVKGVGPTNVQRLLRHIIEQFHKETKKLGGLGYLEGPDRSGKKDSIGNYVQVGFRPMAVIQGIPSDEAPNLVNDGFATDLILTNTKLATQVGGRSYLVPREQKMKVKIEPAPTISNPWSDLMQALKIESTDWDRARINFEMPDGEKGHIMLETFSGSILGDRFLKTINITNISPVLQNCSIKGIVDHFCKKVIPLLD